MIRTRAVAAMPSAFKGLGISFLYPDNWTLEQEGATGGHGSVTVYSPSGAFLTISIYPPLTDPIDLANQAVDGIRDEYNEADVEDAPETILGRELMGYDLNFFCMDLTSTAKVRCLRTDQATYAVFCQAEDADFERLARVFDAITASLLGNLPPLG
jgi:hypothetical protein